MRSLLGNTHSPSGPRLYAGRDQTRILIFFLILSFFAFSCSLTSPVPVTPAGPEVAPAQQKAESPTTTPVLQRSDVISADNAKDVVEIASWGKGSGHDPTYSPDGGLLAVSSSSGIYLYDSQTLQEKMSFSQSNSLDMAFSSDGKTLSAVSGTYYDNTVKQWDVASSSELYSWRVDKKEILNQYTTEPIAALSPDGKTAVISFDENTVKLWDAASGKALHSLSVHVGADLAFSPDSKKLAIGVGDGSVIVWNVATGGQLRTIRPPSQDIMGMQDNKSLAFSPDGKRLAIAADTTAWGNGDNTTVWDVGSGREVLSFNTPVVPVMGNGTVFTLAFSPDGGTLATGTANAIKLWDADGGKELLSIDASNLESLAFSPDGKTLVSASSVGDDSVKLWDVTTGNLLDTVKGDNVGGVAFFSPDSKTLAYASRDYAVKLRDVASGEVRTLSGHPGNVWSLAFSPDGRTLASGSNDEMLYSPGKNVLKLWDVAGGGELHNLSGLTSTAWCVAFSPDGKTLASGSSYNQVNLWDVASGSHLRTLGTLSNDAEIVWSVAFSPDGKVLASGSEDDTVKLWDVASGSELRTLSGHTDSGHTYSVDHLTFSPDGNELISKSSFDLKLWDVASGRELQTYSWDPGTYTGPGMAFSPDGKTLATGLEDGTVKLSDPASGQERTSWSANPKAVSGLAFSPDGKVLASAGGDTIKLWDAASGQELASWSIGGAYTLVFSPDGKLILARSTLGALSLWGVKP